MLLRARPRPAAHDRVGCRRFAERLDAAWDTFVASASTWLEIVVHRWPQAVATVYADVVDGRIPPHQAARISLDPDPLSG